ncbi:MAG: carboxynorspermidine decarboxylase [Bacteroidia bacterium]|nr:carboxynorspermidine decarboxylase [Bacteroidia bacterium]MDW8089316.1 carboxynorspermidine decarboxylase [Bacteroidia bacterium]
MLPSPAFIIDREALRRNLAILEAARAEVGFTLLFALKGFALPAVMEDILAVAEGLAASSLNEALLAYEYGRQKVHLYAPAYRPVDVPKLIPLAETWTFNSLEALLRWTPHLPDSIALGLRVNPHYGSAAADLYNPGQPGSRLGVSPAYADLELPARLTGLHVHTLCEADAESTFRLVEALIHHFHKWLKKVRWVNLGGGHLLTRAGYDRRRFAEAITLLRSEFPNLERIYLEPSAAFVWEAGYLISEVLDLTRNDDRHWAMLDVSFTAHMPDTLEMPYRPVIREALAGPDPAYPTYWLGGITCLAGDGIGPYSFPQPLEVGDRLTFCDMAHYTFVKTTLFNGVAHPAILVKEAKGYRLVKEFGYADYRHRLTNV